MATTSPEPANPFASRRAVLGAGASLLCLGTAGCLGDESATSLSPSGTAAEDGAIPTNGDDLPSVTVPSPLHDTTISTDDYVGDRIQLLTFVASRCNIGCPQQLAALAASQLAAIEDGYGDDVVCLPMTFDPMYDDAEQLAAFSDAVGANAERSNWHFLRPSSDEQAHSIVTDTFGVEFERQGDNGFQHIAVVILANERGIIERTYAGQVPTANELVDDVETVREAID